MSPIRYRERESSSSALAVTVGALAGFATGVLLAQRYGGLAGLTEKIAAIAAEKIAPREEPAVAQIRHRKLLETCAASLDIFLAGDPAQVELRAEDLRLAAHALGRISGRVDVEDVLDQLFARFCVGK